MRTYWKSICTLATPFLGRLIAASFLATITSSLAETLALEWDASASPEAIGYRLYYTQPDGAEQQIHVGNRTDYEVQGLQKGATYTFYATAYDATGRESPPSNLLTYTVPGSDPKPNPYAVPLASYHMTRSGITMTWVSVPGRTYRVLYKNELDEPTWQVLENELLAGGESMYFVDITSPQSPTRFYHVELAD